MSTAVYAGLVSFHTPQPASCLCLYCSEVLQGSRSLGSNISEKGLLQLLFDVRFLSDALAGGKAQHDAPISTKPPR